MKRSAQFLELYKALYKLLWVGYVLSKTIPTYFGSIEPRCKACAKLFRI